MGCGDEKLSKYLTQTFTAHCNAMICQQVTLSSDAEWPKVADAVIEAVFPLQNHGFREEKASFQNRSFLGLTTLSVKICTDATHRRKSISSLQHPLSRVCYDGVAHGQGG